MNQATLYNKRNPIPPTKVVAGFFGSSAAVVRNTERANPLMRFEFALYGMRAFGVWYAEQGWRRELFADLEFYSIWTRRVETIASLEMRKISGPPAV